MPKVDRVEPVLRPLGSRLTALEALLGQIGPLPSEWVIGEENSKTVREGLGLACVECKSYSAMIQTWRKALKWTEGLDCALSVMLASVTSTKAVGDQLWVKIIGPASCGKSTLCEAISVNPRYVVAKSTFRGFHSGSKSEDGEDNALLAQLNGKTFVTKDGDTLLQTPNLTQLLSEARDVYDGVSRTHYRHGLSNDYTGLRLTWILCGTASLRAIDSSELGERFLDCVVMEQIDDELEDEILWRVANRAERNMATEADDNPATNYEPELATAMSMTGGYIDYLRENAMDLLSQVTMPEAAMRRCTRLGKFVAFMRARPSKMQNENSEREFAARLVSQITRLAKCLAVVLNQKTVNNEVMRRVTKVAMDTSRGQTLDIVNHLAKAMHGLPNNALALMTMKDDGQTRLMTRFLHQIKVIELNTSPEPNGVKLNHKKWQLTEKMRRLLRDIEGED